MKSLVKTCLSCCVALCVRRKKREQKKKRKLAHGKKRRKGIKVGLHLPTWSTQSRSVSKYLVQMILVGRYFVVRSSQQHVVVITPPA